MTTPARALEGYLRSMRAWTHAVSAGESVEGLIRVNIPATREWAEALDGRLEFI